MTLILSAPVNPSSGASPEKAWVVFLTTNIEASVEKTLSIYALRWSVEVYFKEASSAKSMGSLWLWQVDKSVK